MTRNDWLQKILAEVYRAEKHGKEFSTIHEAYGVLLEEVDEFWDICKQKKENRKQEAIAEELVQVAAMALKGLESLDNFTSSPHHAVPLDLDLERQQPDQPEDSDS